MRLCTILMLTLLSVHNACAQHEVKLVVEARGISRQDTIDLWWGANNMSRKPLIISRGCDDRVEFNIPINEPRLILLTLRGHQGQMEILASPDEEIHIDGRIRRDNRAPRPTAHFDRLRIQGSQHQQAYNSMLQSHNHFIDSINRYIPAELSRIHAQVESARLQGDLKLLDEICNTIDGQDYLQYIQSKEDEIYDHVLQMVRVHRESFMAPLLALRFLGRLSSENVVIYKMLSNNSRNSYYGKEVKNEVSPESMLGDMAPTITVTDIDGQQKIIGFGSGQGRYILLDFWASYCAPCRKLLPDLKELYQRYHNHGFEIISISLDTDDAEWKLALDQDQMPWPCYRDGDIQSLHEYHARYVPSLFVIDSEGYVVAENLGIKNLRQVIIQLFEQQP